MNGHGLQTGLLPFLILAGAVTVVMLAAAFFRHHRLAASLSGIGLAGAFASLWASGWGGGEMRRQASPLLAADDYSLFFAGLVLAASFVVLVLSYGYLKQAGGNREEFYVVLLAAALGSSAMVASNHFFSFFLGLEILTVSLYGMIAYFRSRERSLEAGVKYLVLAGVSSGFLLFGMALLYAELGTMEFSKLGAAISSRSGGDAILLAGFAMMVVGIGFKLAVVPFHMWTPDVYEGAPAPVAAFIATISKGAMMALLLRFALVLDLYRFSAVMSLFTLIAIASMFTGNLLALLQSNFKRLLAYSSISHLGYILVAFVSGGAMAAEAISFYLVAYTVTMLSAFGFVTLLSTPGAGERDSIDDYEGLFGTHPWIAGMLTVALLSLAGIPLTAGFIGKYLVIAAGVGVSRWVLVILLAVNSAIGLYYYLRVVVVMIPKRAPAAAAHAAASSAARPPEGAARTPVEIPTGTLPAKVALALLTIAILWLGLYPPPLAGLIRSLITASLP